MTAHLGAELAALVDGELDHASRERVLRHLTRCQDCRTEADAERRFTARLRGLAATAPGPPDDLTARLRAVAAQPDQAPWPPDTDRRAGWPTATWPADPWPVDDWAGVARPAPGLPALRGLHGRTGPRVAVGGAVLAVGLGAVLAFSGAHRAPPRGPADPGGDTFLVDDLTPSGQLPLPQPVGVGLVGLSHE